MANELELQTEIEGHKRCADCGVVKPLTVFARNRNQTAARGKPLNHCRDCAVARTLAWTDRNRDKVLNAHLRRTFGITLDEYTAMADAQGGVCAICGSPPTVMGGIKRSRHRKSAPPDPRLAVDHDHQTGQVRGLLCIPCNRGIGFLRDNPDLCDAAAVYLREGAR